MLVGSRDLHQLDAVAEGVEDVRAAEVVDGRVFAGGKSGALAGQDNFVEVVHSEGGMSATRGVEVGVGFDAEMQIYWADCKPDAVAIGHCWRLFHLGETENADVERARGFFAAGWDCDLDMVEVKDWHCLFLTGAGRRLPTARRRNSCRGGLRRGTSGVRAGTGRSTGICSGA